MKRKELKEQVSKDMSIDALNEEQLSLLKEQFNLKVQRATGQLKQSHRMKEIRKNIARIKTILTEKNAGETV